MAVLVVLLTQIFFICFILTAATSNGIITIEPLECEIYYVIYNICAGTDKLSITATS